MVRRILLCFGANEKRVFILPKKSSFPIAYIFFNIFFCMAQLGSYKMMQQ